MCFFAPKHFWLSFQNTEEGPPPITPWIPSTYRMAFNASPNPPLFLAEQCFEKNSAFLLCQLLCCVFRPAYGCLGTWKLVAEYKFLFLYPIFLLLQPRILNIELHVFWHIYLSVTYCHKTGTRPPSCQASQQPTIYTKDLDPLAVLHLDNQLYIWRIRGWLIFGFKRFRPDSAS